MHGERQVGTPEEGRIDNEAEETVTSELFHSFSRFFVREAIQNDLVGHQWESGLVCVVSRMTVIHNCCCSFLRAAFSAPAVYLSKLGTFSGFRLS